MHAWLSLAGCAATAVEDCNKTDGTTAVVAADRINFLRDNDFDFFDTVQAFLIIKYPVF